MDNEDLSCSSSIISCSKAAFDRESGKGTNFPLSVKSYIQCIVYKKQISLQLLQHIDIPIHTEVMLKLHVFHWNDVTENVDACGQKGETEARATHVGCGISL